MGCKCNYFLLDRRQHSATRNYLFSTEHINTSLMSVSRVSALTYIHCNHRRFLLMKRKMILSITLGNAFRALNYAGDPGLIVSLIHQRIVCYSIC